MPIIFKEFLLNLQVTGATFIALGYFINTGPVFVSLSGFVLVWLK